MRKIKKVRILVMGLGLNKGGESVARYFATHGASVTVTDLKTRSELSRPIRSLSRYAAVRYVLGRHDPNDFRTHDLILQNPGIRQNSPYLAIARKNNVPITNEAAYFIANTKAHVIGVTGTRGKSTTSTILYKLLSSYYHDRGIYLAGNIATHGMLDLLDVAKSTDIVILELSSFHLEHLQKIRKAPYIGVLTSIYEDHLNRYHSYAAYINAKKNMFRHQTKRDVAIINYDSARARQFSKITKARVVFFSAEHRVSGLYARSGFIWDELGAHKKKIMPIQGIRGLENSFIDNYLAAATAARVLHVPVQHIKKIFSTSLPLPRFRFQHIARRGGIDVINDSCATAPIATEKALAKTRAPVVLIAGGVDKKLSYKSLAKKISTSVEAVILLPGSASKKIEDELRLRTYKAIYKVSDLRKAVARAFSLRGINTILFSPGAASFNLFVNEFDRGDQFNKAVRYALRNS